MIARHKEISIGGESLIVSFPNVGQIIDIESLKLALTNNKYGAMASSGIVSMYYALDIVDAISFFRVCLPEFSKENKLDMYLSIQVDKINQIVDAYKNQIKPWLDETMNKLKGISKNDENTDK